MGKKEDSRFPLKIKHDGVPEETKIEDLNSPWWLLSEICQIGVYPALAQRPNYPGGPWVMDSDIHWAAQWFDAQEDRF